MSRHGGTGPAPFAPGLDRLRNYERSWLRADLLGGLTVGAMLIPQSMAYAELAGMPPEAGFYAVLLALFAYAIVGTSRHLGVGPARQPHLELEGLVERDGLAHAADASPAKNSPIASHTRSQSSTSRSW